MLGPRLVGVYVCSPMNAESDVVRADKHRKRGWSLGMYVRFWVGRCVCMLRPRLVTVYVC